VFSEEVLTGWLQLRVGALEEVWASGKDHLQLCRICPHPFPFHPEVEVVVEGAALQNPPTHRYPRPVVRELQCMAEATDKTGQVVRSGNLTQQMYYSSGIYLGSTSLAQTRLTFKCCT
jgi:hypothetical protein